MQQEKKLVKFKANPEFKYLVQLLREYDEVGLDLYTELREQLRAVKNPAAVVSAAFEQNKAMIERRALA